MTADVASAGQMAELARLADSYGSGEIRLTTGQNAIILGVPVDDVPLLLARPLLEKFSPEPHAFTRGLVSCVGNDYCNLALIETKSLARAWPNDWRSDTRTRRE